MKYLFMMPLITMVFFIPVGTFMLEVHKSKQSREHQENTSDNPRICMKWSKIVTKKEVSSIYQSLLKASPVIISSALGVIFNFSFQSEMPAVLHQPLKVSITLNFFDGHLNK